MFALCPLHRCITPLAPASLHLSVSAASCFMDHDNLLLTRRCTCARAVPSPEPVLEGNTGHEDGSQGPESQSSTPDEDPTPHVAHGAGFKALPTELAEHTVVSSGLLPCLTVQPPSDDPTPSVGMSCSHSDAFSTGSLVSIPRKKTQKGKEKDVVLPNVLSRISSHLAAEAPQALPSHASSSLSGPGCPSSALLVFSLRPSSFTPSFASVTAGSFLAGPSNRIHTLCAALALPFSEVVPSASSRSQLSSVIDHIRLFCQIPVLTDELKAHLHTIFSEAAVGVDFSSQAQVASLSFLLAQVTPGLDFSVLIAAAIPSPSFHGKIFPPPFPAFLIPSPLSLSFHAPAFWVHSVLCHSFCFFHCFCLLPAHFSSSPFGP